jgi:hypothetical protein
MLVLYEVSIEFLFNLFTKHWLGIKAEFRVSEEAVLNVRKKTIERWLWPTVADQKILNQLIASSRFHWKLSNNRGLY